MDTGIVFAIVLAILFFGGISWLIIYSRKEDQRHIQTSDTHTEPRPKSRAA